MFSSSFSIKTPFIKPLKSYPGFANCFGSSEFRKVVGLNYRFKKKFELLTHSSLDNHPIFDPCGGAFIRSHSGGVFEIDLVPVPVHYVVPGDVDVSGIGELLRGIEAHLFRLGVKPCGFRVVCPSPIGTCGSIGLALEILSGTMRSEFHGEPDMSGDVLRVLVPPRVSYGMWNFESQSIIYVEYKVPPHSYFKLQHCGLVYPTRLSLPTLRLISSVISFGDRCAFTPLLRGLVTGNSLSHVACHSCVIVSKWDVIVTYGISPEDAEVLFHLLHRPIVVAVSVDPSSLYNPEGPVFVVGSACLSAFMRVRFREDNAQYVLLDGRLNCAEGDFEYVLNSVLSLGKHVTYAGALSFARSKDLGLDYTSGHSFNYDLAACLPRIASSLFGRCANREYLSYLNRFHVLEATDGFVHSNAFGYQWPVRGACHYPYSTEELYTSLPLGTTLPANIDQAEVLKHVLTSDVYAKSAGSLTRLKPLSVLCAKTIICEPKFPKKTLLRSYSVDDILSSKLYQESLRLPGPMASLPSGKPDPSQWFVMRRNGFLIMPMVVNTFNKDYIIVMDDPNLGELVHSLFFNVISSSSAMVGLGLNGGRGSTYVALDGPSNWQECGAKYKGGANMRRTVFDLDLVYRGIKDAPFVLCEGSRIWGSEFRSTDLSEPSDVPIGGSFLLRSEYRARIRGEVLAPQMKKRVQRLNRAVYSHAHVVDNLGNHVDLDF